MKLQKYTQTAPGVNSLFWKQLVQVFNRERLNGHYGVVAFVIGNSLSSLPFLFLIAVVSSIIVYFMAQLHPGFEHFAYFVLSLFAQVAIVESLMMAVASVVPNFLMGIITGAGIQVSKYMSTLVHVLTTSMWVRMVTHLVREITSSCIDQVHWLNVARYRVSSCWWLDSSGSSTISLSPSGGTLSRTSVSTCMPCRYAHWWQYLIWCRTNLNESTFGFVGF